MNTRVVTDPIHGFEKYQNHLAPPFLQGTEQLEGIDFAKQILKNAERKFNSFKAKVMTLFSEKIWIDHGYIENKIKEIQQLAHNKVGAQSTDLSSIEQSKKELIALLSTLKLTRQWINHLTFLDPDQNVARFHTLITQSELLTQEIKRLIADLDELIKISNFMDERLAKLIRSREVSSTLVGQIISSLRIALKLILNQNSEKPYIKAKANYLLDKLHGFRISENPLPLKKQKKMEILPNFEIPAYNRRIVPAEKVSLKLRRAFEAAQKRLNDGHKDNWKCADEQKSLKLDCQVDAENTPALGKVGIASAKGRRDDMQDAHLATVLNVKGIAEPISLYAIFDGHSGNPDPDPDPEREICSDFLARHLPHYLEENLPNVLQAVDKEAKLFNLLKLAFVHLGERFRRENPDLKYVEGTTANIALIIGKELWVANVGDTRSIICSNKNAIALSEDAKPNFPDYERNVRRRRGKVGPDGNSTYRVWPARLAIARGVGHEETLSGVNPRAKIVKFCLEDLPPGKNYLIIGCDGLFDVASSQQVARTVTFESCLRKNPSEIAKILAQKAYSAGSTDNISVLVLNLSSLNR